VNHEVRPAPSEEEAAAIAAAIELLWPRPATIAQPTDLAWRLSGRAWQRSAMTTSRPWL
jgi:hypothetical protein